MPPYRTRKEVERCLRAIGNLHVGSSTRTEVEQAIRPWVAPGVITMSGDPANPQPIGYIRFESDPTLFQVRLSYDEKNILSRKTVSYTHGGQAWPNLPYFQVVTTESPAGFPAADEQALPLKVEHNSRKLEVLLAPSASDTLHMQAFGYNLKCIASATNCVKPDDVLPGMKEYFK